MCGRYFISIEDIEMQEILKAVKNAAVGEIYPTNDVAVINEYGEVATAKWGFDSPFGKPIINARGETVTEKKMFKKCIEERRCIVPATSYYEWNKAKEKYEFSIAGSNVIYLAGIINDKNQMVILTTEAQDDIGKIHHRMPIILKGKKTEDWLNNKKYSLSNAKVEYKIV